MKFRETDRSVVSNAGTVGGRGRVSWKDDVKEEQECQSKEDRCPGEVGHRVLGQPQERRAPQASDIRSSDQTSCPRNSPKWRQSEEGPG